MSKSIFSRPISRSVAVIVTYTLLVLGLVLVFTIGLPPVFTEGQKLINNLPNLISSLPLPPNFSVSFESLVPQFSEISKNVLNFTLDIFSNLTSVFSILMLSIYMSMDWENLKTRLFGLFKSAEKKLLQDIVTDSEQTIGEWIKGQAFLMLVIGVASYSGLLVIGVDYPLALGIIAGVLEAVPVIGPIISGVIAAVIGFSQSPLKGAAAVLLFFVIQQLENNFLVPRVMGKVSGYGPIVILFVLIIASNFFGMLGALLAMPVFLITMIVVKRVLQYTARN
jgi:predicted PurR-regulated permease PerM